MTIKSILFLLAFLFVVTQTASSMEDVDLVSAEYYRAQAPATKTPKHAPYGAPVSTWKKAPTPAPANIPIPSPRKAPAPSKIPVPAPNKAPVHAPSNAPVPSPHTAPAPAKIPVLAPNKAPVHAPSNAPVHAPAISPVQSPRKAPAHPPLDHPKRGCSSMCIRYCEPSRKSKTCVEACITVCKKIKCVPGIMECPNWNKEMMALISLAK